MQQEKFDQIEEKKIETHEELELNELRATVILTDEQLKQVSGGVAHMHMCW